MRRTVTSELLDSDAGTPEEVAAALADLRMINRRFGGTRVMRELVTQVARATGARELTLLDPPWIIHGHRERARSISSLR